MYAIPYMQRFFYLDTDVVKHKRLKDITPAQVKNAFGGDNITVFTDSQKLKSELGKMSLDNTVLLFMTSGNFSGLNLNDFAKELSEKK